MEQNNIRQLTRAQSAAFVAGGVLMVAGMGCFVFMALRPWSAAAYLAGAALFAVLQCMQTYHGEDFTVKRLKNIMTMADLLFVLAGVLMIDTCTQFLRPLFSNVMNYYTYLYNKWLVALLVAVALELYSVNRISYKLRK